MEALKMLIPKRVAPSTPLPVPPPPLPPVEDPHRSYEKVEGFLKKAYYEQINPESLNAPVSYADPKLPQEKKSPFLKRANALDKGAAVVGGKLQLGEAATPVIVEEKVADVIQPEVAIQKPKREIQDRAERKLSRSYSDEQMEKVLEMLQQVMQMEGMKEQTQHLYDDITSSQPSHPPEKVWGQATGYYVDMDTIDSSYDIISDSPKHDAYDTIPYSPIHGASEHRYCNVSEPPKAFYYNLHAKPPLPPKPSGRSPSPKLAVMRKKPGISPKPDRLSQPQRKQASFGKGFSNCPVRI